jgi:transmembrane protein TMEM174 (potassium channel)
MGWSIRRKLGGTPAGTFSPSENTGTQGRLLPTGRLEAFSDGVFAIAITLLVLELHVPGKHQVLATALEHEWPRYLGYFVSFAFIGGVWIAHSNLTRFIKAAGRARQAGMKAGLRISTHPASANCSDPDESWPPTRSSRPGTLSLPKADRDLP